MDELMAPMMMIVEAILSYNDAVIDLGKECNSASFHHDKERNSCYSALENFKRQHELLVSEFGKLTCSFDAMTRHVRELTVALHANAAEPDAVQTEKCNMATWPTSTTPEVEHGIAAPDEAVEHNMAASHPDSASPVDPNKTA